MNTYGCKTKIKILWHGQPWKKIVAWAAMIKTYNNARRKGEMCDVTMEASRRRRSIWWWFWTYFVVNKFCTKLFFHVIIGIDQGRSGVTATTPDWFVVRHRDVPRAQLALTSWPWSIPSSHREALTRYVKLRVAHAPGMSGMFSPPPTSKESTCQLFRHASRHVRHARAVMHVGISNPLWRGKRSLYSRCMPNPQCYNTIQYNATQRNATQRNAMQYNTIQ